MALKNKLINHIDKIKEIVLENELLKYTLGDNRKVSVEFYSVGDDSKIIETFDAETQNSLELQKTGWQAILDNFKKYVEEN